MSEFDIDLLRALRGDKIPGLTWGAVMSVSIEWLKGQGYVKHELDGDTLNYVLTDKGLKAISEMTER